MIAKQAFLVLLMLLVFPALQAQAQSGGQLVGWVQEAEGSVILKGAAGRTRPAVVKDEVLAGDTVFTGPGGRAQIIFTDQTMLAMGENSELVIRDAMDLNGGTFDLEIVSGVARVVTSKVVSANPDKFKMETPLGTIGIRGTEFGSLVENGREVHMLYSGGPVLYTDQQCLSGNQNPLKEEACTKLARARYLTEQVLYGAVPIQYQQKGKMQTQLKEIKELQYKYGCVLIKE